MGTDTKEKLSALIFLVRMLILLAAALIGISFYGDYQQQLTDNKLQQYGLKTTAMIQTDSETNEIEMTPVFPSITYHFHTRKNKMIEGYGKYIAPDDKKIEIFYLPDDPDINAPVDDLNPYTNQPALAALKSSLLMVGPVMITLIIIVLIAFWHTKRKGRKNAKDDFSNKVI